MAVLAFDTATPVLAVGLKTNSGVLSADFRADRRHAELLFVKINELLNDACLKAKDLKAVGCGLGPGSFIGSRIAVVSAKTMAQILDIPLIGVPTLDIVARRAKNDYVLAASDAMRGEIFYAFYKEGKRVSDIEVSKPEELKKLLQKKQNILVTGNAYGKYPGVFEGFKILTNEKLWYPGGSSLAEIAFEKYESGRFEDYIKLEPIYVREADARESFISCKK